MNVGDVTCFENVVANVEGETAPSRHGLGDAFRDVAVLLGLAETDLVLSLEVSEERLLLPGLETVKEFDLFPKFVRLGSSLFTFGETDLGVVRPLDVSGLKVVVIDVVVVVVVIGDFFFFSSIGSRMENFERQTC